MNINLSLALIMVLIGGLLKFVHRTPKTEKPFTAAVVVQIDTIASKKLPFRAASE